MNSEYSHKSYSEFEERGRKKEKKKNSHRKKHYSPRRRKQKRKFNTNSASTKGFSSWIIPKLAHRIENKYYIHNKYSQIHIYGGFARHNNRIL